MATVRDPNGAAPGGYSASINWGDGSTSNGIFLDGNPLEGIGGEHGYTSAGTYSVTVDVHSSRGGDDAVVSLQISVVPAPPITFTSLSPVELIAGDYTIEQELPTFADPSPLASTTTSYQVTINWGDGQSSAGTIYFDPSTGHLGVDGDHTYTGPGTYAVTVTIDRADGSIASDTFQIALTPPPPPSNLAALAWQLTHDTDYYSAFVTWAYQQFMGRAPDATGSSYWVGQMQNGLTDEQLESRFLSAPEYIANHGGSDVNWVIGMYHDLLGRAPDSQGLAYWTSQIELGAAEYNIALGFATSGEREATVVQNDYSKYLGRRASQDEVNYWVNQFLNGTRNEDVIAGFIGSAEYYNNVNKGDGDRTTWVDSVFEDLYNRQPTSNELSDWLGQMD